MIKSTVMCEQCVKVTLRNSFCEFLVWGSSFWSIIDHYPKLPAGEPPLWPRAFLWRSVARTRRQSPHTVKMAMRVGLRYLSPNFFPGLLRLSSAAELAVPRPSWRSSCWRTLSSTRPVSSGNVNVKKCREHCSWCGSTCGAAHAFLTVCRSFRFNFVSDFGGRITFPASSTSRLTTSSHW